MCSMSSWMNAASDARKIDAIATLARAALADGAGAFDFSLEGRGSRRHEPDAHPIEQQVGDVVR